MWFRNSCLCEELLRQLLNLISAKTTEYLNLKLDIFEKVSAGKGVLE